MMGIRYTQTIKSWVAYYCFTTTMLYLLYVQQEKQLPPAEIFTVKSVSFQASKITAWTAREGTENAINDLDCLRSQVYLKLSKSSP